MPIFVRNKSEFWQDLLACSVVFQKNFSTSTFQFWFDEQYPPQPDNYNEWIILRTEHYHSYPLLAINVKYNLNSSSEFLKLKFRYFAFIPLILSFNSQAFSRPWNPPWVCLINLSITSAKIHQHRVQNKQWNEEHTQANYNRSSIFSRGYK